ncbi:glutathione ABC transporter permease GsiD [Caldinitratiruptor microaerophilus]|uniref:Glutathione ABC transporter permease GsiD n=1 Tax=Caldinitratiruptor microaerophilus TaxID=671077 RepID=A0AA35CIW3_9FIRM|nr:glutathione ABC transporter permease GsiD [Caldinitratiruptor microaerophilus]
MRTGLRSGSAAAGGLLVLGLALLALLAPWLTPADPLNGDVHARLLPPGPGHPLGTDPLGRDLLARLLYGGRYSLGAAGVVATATLLLGLTVGIVAGYFKGWVDAVLMRLADLVRAFPGRILALVLVGALGPGLKSLMLAMVAVSWVSQARLVRGLTLAAREQEYVLAARVCGLRPVAIVLRHILPAVLPQVAVVMALDMSWFLMSLSAFSLLGLGVQPPAPEWGMMVSEARPYFRTHPHLLLWPGVAIMLAVLGFTLLGEGLRDAWDPHRRGVRP